MFVQRGGSGPPLVLIHGYLVSSHYFRAVRPQLEAHYDVIAVDLPGHGESDSPSPERFPYSFAQLAESVAQVMDKLGVARAHVWGHSMGGGTALHLAAMHPARVGRLLLEDSLGLAMPMPWLAHVGDLPLLGGFIYRYLYSRRDLSSHLKGVHLSPTLCTDEEVDFYWERFNRPGARLALHAMLHMIMTMPAESNMPARVKSPTLVAFGADEKTVPVENGRRIAAGIQGARFEVIPDCGHSPHEERPDKILELALPFFAAAGASDGAAKATG